MKTTDPIKPRPLIECTPEDLVNRHALLYGRYRIWTPDLENPETSEETFRWSKWAWWKAFWSEKNGPPSLPGSWVFYSTEGVHQARGAEITHFMRMPDIPEGAPVNEYW